MDIRSITHEGLRDCFLNGSTKGLRQQSVPRVWTVLFALQGAPDIETVEGPPGWRIHRLKGSKAGEWSISVLGSWRLTFKIEDGAIVDLNPEDYH